MKKYNIQDVKLTEKLYKKLQGWIKIHPNHNLETEDMCCPNCGSFHLQKRGVQISPDKQIPKIPMYAMQQVVERKKTYRKNKVRLNYTHIRKVEMDIQLIALHMLDKTIDNVDIVHGEDTMVIHLDDGSSVELIIDSAYMNVQDLDD